MSLKPVLIVYNTFMALVNFALFLWFLVLSRGGRELFNLVAPSESDTSAQQMSMIRFTELFLVTKFLDLLDTVFIVLRKKGDQKNFLHLYHHSIVPIVLSVSFMLYPTGMTSGIFAFVNTFTHSVMFAYYGCAAIGPSMRPYLWWKKYITQLQIIQFFIFIFFAIAYGTISTGYSMAYVWIGISQSPLFAFLFIRFYLQSYKQNNVLTEDRLKVK
ncbi:Elongation of very long chain fatty acids protein 7 [Tyrophagus putrescentiae]|nr:Elongation of very long chain fatty acids protein 7 [Tyrophagus putrescentiae]